VRLATIEAAGEGWHAAMKAVTQAPRKLSIPWASERR
jgi:hypothetical protein